MILFYCKGTEPGRVTSVRLTCLQYTSAFQQVAGGRGDFHDQRTTLPWGRRC